MSTPPTKRRSRLRLSPYFIKRLSSWLLLSTALTVAVRSASTLYWDADANPVGDAVTGAALGGDGVWDTSTHNWWDGATNDVAWNNGTPATAVFTGSSGTAALGTAVVARGLTFNTSGYTVTNGGNTANTLTLTDKAVIEVKDLGNSATVGAAIQGTSGLTKSGNGVLFLTNNANAYTGDTVINGGSLVITDQGQLGAGTTTISVNGFANTGNPGYSGGQLVIQGGIAGITVDRGISVAGRGPGSANGTGGLISIGNNTLTGDLVIGSTGSEARVMATPGNTTPDISRKRQRVLTLDIGTVRPHL